MVACQFALYPLREPRIGPVLEAALAQMRSKGLEPEVGAMSTFVVGDGAAVFDGLRHAFEAAAERGDVVLIATVSNACPVDPGPGA